MSTKTEFKPRRGLVAYTTSSGRNHILPARQQRNLAILRDHLESLPGDYAHFKMACWFDASPRNKINTLAQRKIEAEYAARNGGVASRSCGAVACAVGHGPEAGLLVDPKFISETGGVAWQAYARETFTVERFSTVLMDWLFDGAWNRSDNHHWGAAARITLILEGYGVPEEFVEYQAPGKRFCKLYRQFDKRYRGTVDA